MPEVVDWGFGVVAETLWRSSLILAAMVVLAAYAAALTLSIFLGGSPSNQTAYLIILVATMLLAVLALGFVLWRSESQSGP